MFESLRSKYSKIEWSEIANIRDNLIHSCFFDIENYMRYSYTGYSISFEKLKDIEPENWNLDIDF